MALSSLKLTSSVSGTPSRKKLQYGISEGRGRWNLRRVAGGRCHRMDRLSGRRSYQNLSSIPSAPTAHSHAQASNSKEPSLPTTSRQSEYRTSNFDSALCMWDHALQMQDPLREHTPDQARFLRCGPPDRPRPLHDQDRFPTSP